MNKRILKKASRLFSEKHCEFKNESVLTISETKGELPFLYILVDENHPNHLIVSFAVDYPCASNAACCVLSLNNIAPVLILENYYVNNVGHTVWGDEADKQYAIQKDFPIEQFDPSNTYRH